MKTRQFKQFALSLGAAYLMFSGSAAALVIDNDLLSSTVGFWSVDVRTGGEAAVANLTAVGTPSGTIHTSTQVIFDYFSYVDVGSGGFRLLGSAPASAGDDAVSSSGLFLNAAGNTIDWSVTSSIPNLGDTMTSTFVFSAANGTLGNFRFYQYLDEDVLGFSNDVFFTRGTIAGLDLELFTVDNAEAIGVSHSGGLAGAQGLVNASLAGWAACTFNQMKPAIGAGTQTVSLGGDICASLAGSPFNHAVVGSVLGPLDIVSVLAWDVDQLATSATIITTLGGVASAADIPPEAIPEPASLALFGVGLLGLGFLRRRRPIA